MRPGPVMSGRRSMRSPVGRHGDGSSSEARQSLQRGQASPCWSRSWGARSGRELARGIGAGGSAPGLARRSRHDRPLTKTAADDARHDGGSPGCQIPVALLSGRLVSSGRAPSTIQTRLRILIGGSVQRGAPRHAEGRRTSVPYRCSLAGWQQVPLATGRLGRPVLAVIATWIRDAMRTRGWLEQTRPACPGPRAQGPILIQMPIEGPRTSPGSGRLDKPSGTSESGH